MVKPRMPVKMTIWRMRGMREGEAWRVRRCVSRIVKARAVGEEGFGGLEAGERGRGVLVQRMG